ncbi:MAG: hemolysin family protein, partial [Dehalococcoidia bacterium]
MQARAGMMAAIGIELLIIVLLVLLNGVLAMSEMAIVSARTVRLQQRADAGDAGAQAALNLANEPNRFLSTVQIGITAVGILAGAFGGATLAENLGGRLEETGLSPALSNAVGVALVVLGITYLSLIVGELVPKRLALQQPERLASAVARPMRLVSTIAAPIVALLSVSTEVVLRLLGVRSREELPVSEEEIKILIQQSTEAGVFEPTEQEMVSSIFRLGDRHVDDLMVPRRDVVWLEIEEPPEVLWQKMTESPHNRFPVCRGNLDTVLGTVTLKDLWTHTAQARDGQPPDMTTALRPALVVPEGLPVLRALDRLKQAGTGLAIVVDEYGGTSGVITLTDVLEAIVGDLPSPEEEAEPQIVRRDDGSWLVDGLAPIEEIKERLRLKSLPEEGDYQTLAGFVLLEMQRVPAVGESFIWDDL